jgi:hypothetical protein
MQVTPKQPAADVGHLQCTELERGVARALLLGPRGGGRERLCTLLCSLLRGVVHSTHPMAATLQCSRRGFQRVWCVSVCGKCHASFVLSERVNRLGYGQSRRRGVHVCVQGPALSTAGQRPPVLPATAIPRLDLVIFTQVSWWMSHTQKRNFP